jgi:hypothetical protein
MGWEAALAMRYAVANQERRVSELNSLAIGAESVAMMVESRDPRKTPVHEVPKMSTKRVVGIFSASNVLSSSCALPLGGMLVTSPLTAGGFNNGVHSSAEP